MENGILNILYRKYYDEILLYLYSLSHNYHLAEDLTQETFLKALLSLPGGHSNMRAWLYMVGRNLYFNYYSKEKPKVPLLEAEEIPAGEGDEPAKDLLREEGKRMLFAGLEKLSREKREVLQLQYFGGLSQKEIAAVMHITPENVRVLAYRAKQELRKYMEVHDYDIS